MTPELEMTLHVDGNGVRLSLDASPLFPVGRYYIGHLSIAGVDFIAEAIQVAGSCGGRRLFAAEEKLDPRLRAFHDVAESAMLRTIIVNHHAYALVIYPESE